jgi:hypothetical protein
MFAKNRGNGGFNKQDYNYLSERYLEQNGFNPHEIKQDALGKKAKISHYDIYRNSTTKELYVAPKGVKGTPIPTGIIFD